MGTEMFVRARWRTVPLISCRSHSRTRPSSAPSRRHSVSCTLPDPSPDDAGRSPDRPRGSTAERSVLLQSPDQGAAAHAETAGSLGLIPTDGAQSLADDLALHRLDVIPEVQRSTVRRLGVRGPRWRLRRQPALIYRVLGVGDDRPAFDDVLQLPDVSRPGVLLEPSHRSRVHAADRVARSDGLRVKEVFDQEGDVLLAFSQ